MSMCSCVAWSWSFPPCRMTGLRSETREGHPLPEHNQMVRLHPSDGAFVDSSRAPESFLLRCREDLPGGKQGVERRGKAAVDGRLDDDFDDLVAREPGAQGGADVDRELRPGGLAARAVRAAISRSRRPRPGRSLTSPNGNSTRYRAMSGLTASTAARTSAPPRPSTREVREAAGVAGAFVKASWCGTPERGSMASSSGDEGVILHTPRMEPHIPYVQYIFTQELI
jgi:hypothetical protein